jgi:hypothetical protein
MRSGGAKLRSAFGILPSMTDADTASDSRARRLYIGVFLCEAATLLGLWLIGRIFS